MKTIAIFDFDGTITTKDTLFDFIRFSLGYKKLFLGLFLLSPLLMLYKLKILSNQFTKEKLFMYFFKGIHANEYYEYCLKYASEIDKIKNNKAISKMLWHKNQDHIIICISASMEDWIIPWARNNFINQVIATKIEIHNHLITGKFHSKNCYGKEKANRFLAEYPERKKYQIYVYGDSKGDKELLEMADYKFYRSF